jgi:flagellar motor switch protein FliN
MKPDRARPGRWFAEEWTTLLGNVLESLAGERPQLESKAPEGDAGLAATAQELDQQHGTILWWEQAFPLPGDPAVWIGAPQQNWSQLAGRVLGAAGVDDDSQSRETYLEILQQSLGELARSAARRWNRQVDCPVGAERSAPPPADDFYLVEVSYPGLSVPPLLVAITGAPEDPPAETPKLESPALPAVVPEPAPPAQSKTFELLMGVELPVSVSFGHVQIPLKEVLKLTAGSIIELNRTVDEPVEVIVNNCVVARGEVVVVEGNYGVRIHQIMSRQQRLENLP